MDPADTEYSRIRAAPFHDAGYGYDELGLYPPALAMATELSRFLYDSYFRVTSQGIENVPASGPTILVANHGGILPIDAAMLSLDILRRMRPTRIPRPIADTFVPRLPLISTLFARLGVVSGTRTNVRRLLERDELIAIWPEGVSGPAKHRSQRYRIQDWRVGFAELAIRYGARIVPVAIIGAEESWPLLAKLRGMRALGIPYVPVPTTPIPRPTPIRIVYGERIEPYLHPARSADPRSVEELATRAREQVEALIASARAEQNGATPCE